MNQETTHLETSNNGEEIVHVWDEDQVWAIRTALAASRPLLVRGEPGIGKTQLAWAAAKKLNRPIVSFTVDANTESRDLLWTFDAVERLAEAQVADRIYGDDLDELKKKLSVANFVEPGPVWWGINWKSAADQFDTLKRKLPETPEGWIEDADGVVILIDEIDKADSDVPNGLLEAFGMQQFTPQGWPEPIKPRPGVSPPLIVITSNQERTLPDPFLRRCIVIDLELPHCPTAEELEEDENSAEEFLEHLVCRGKARFGDAIPNDQLQQAANMLLEDRQTAIELGQHPKPGQAEYFDFLRAMVDLVKDEMQADAKLSTEEAYEKVSARVKKFIFQKSPSEQQ